VDASLKSLFDLVAGSENKSSNRSVRLLFQQLTSEVGAGTCGKCHTVDREQDAHVVNWKAVYRTTSTRGFTAFSHYPHLLDSSGGSCVSCHRLDESERKSVTFHGDDPHQFASNFTPIRKADCAACHQQGMAKNTCTECHNYHVGSPVSLKDN
jgi:hypothetical protein